MQWLKKIFNWNNGAPQKVTTLRRDFTRAVEESLVDSPKRNDVLAYISKTKGVALIAEQYKDTGCYDIYSEFTRYRRGSYGDSIGHKISDFKKRCHTNVPYLEMIKILEDYDDKAALEAVPVDLRPHQERVQDYIKDNIEGKRKRNNVKRVHQRQAKKGKFQH